MTTAFYERFSDKTQVEAFSADAVFTQFSKTDADYTDCDGTPPSDESSEETKAAYQKNCDYKDSVDKLYQFRESKELTEKSLDDGDQQYAAKVLDSANLVIGISIMLGAIYYMNQ